MNSPDQRSKPDVASSEQSILNLSQDKDFDILAVEMIGHNLSGNTLERIQVDGSGRVVTSNSSMVGWATIAVTVGSVKYVAIAPPGTLHTDAEWQAQKVDQSTTNTTVVTFADGDDNFDNTPGDDGVNLSGLSYS